MIGVRLFETPIAFWRTDVGRFLRVTAVDCADRRDRVRCFIRNEIYAADLRFNLTSDDVDAARDYYAECARQLK